MNDETPKKEPKEKEIEELETIEEHTEEIKEEEPVETELEKHKFVFDVVLNEKVKKDEVYHERV